MSGMLLLPWAVLDFTWPSDYRFWFWLLPLIPLDIAAMLLYIKAISAAPLSHTLPYLALTPVCAALTGWLLLGETIGWEGMGGIGLVSLGVYLLNINASGNTSDLLAPVRFILRERGPRLMVIVALLMSLSSAVGKGAVAYMPGAHFGAAYSVVMALVVMMLAWWRRRSFFRVLRAKPAGCAVVSANMALMVVTHFAAIELITAAYMVAVKRSSMIFGLILGAWLFNESGLLRNLFACAVMLLGVAVLALN